MTFILFNYLYDIIHIYKPWLTQMVNCALKGKILLISVNYEKDFGKWKCNSFDQIELWISILIQIKELLLMVLKYTLEFEKGQALYKLFDRNQNIKTLAEVTLALKSIQFTTVPKHDS